MNETTIDWDNWRLFMAVARARGLAGAARATGKSAPTLSRRMQLLEQQTGQELFQRRSKSFELTDAGAGLFERISAIESELHIFDGPRDGRGKSLVKVSAGSWMTYGLCQHLELITRHAVDARVRFISAEAVLDISRRETTIGIRNSRPTQANLVCRKIGRVQFAVYATRRSTTNVIEVQQDTQSATWARAARIASEKSGVASGTPGDVVFEVTSPRNALDIACTGKAAVVLPTFVGDQVSRLKRVAPPIPELAHDQWLVTHPAEQYHAQVRKVIDGLYRAAKALHRVREDHRSSRGRRGGAKGR